MTEKILVAILAADAVFLLAALVRELILSWREKRTSRRLSAPDHARYTAIINEIYNDWRGRRYYYPPRYHAFFEANDDARIAYAQTVAAGIERSEGRTPVLGDPKAAGEAFRTRYAWELHQCR